MKIKKFVSIVQENLKIESIYNYEILVSQMILVFNISSYSSSPKALVINVHSNFCTLNLAAKALDENLSQLPAHFL